MDKNLPVFTVDKLKFWYMLGKQKIEALRGITINIPKSKVICLSGPSGSGKTSFLSVLGMIEPIHEGSVVFENKDLSKITEPEKNTLRRYHIGFVFQQFHLLPVLNAMENVEYFLHRQGVEPEERKKIVRDSLEAVGLWEHRTKKPLEMSGGQRQRVAIARAIAKSPSVIIADEPTASLDQNTGREIMNIFVDLVKERGVSVITASHDPMVHSFAEKHYYMQDGQISNYHGGTVC